MIPGPVTLHLDITNGCNADCVTCWDHSPLLRAPRDPVWQRQRATVVDLLAIVDDAAAIPPGRLQSVIISGMGEPLTHPDVYDLLTRLVGRGLRVTVITNLLAAEAGRLAATGVETLLVGLHAADAAGYRAFHPSAPADAWDRVLDQLGRRLAAGRRDKHVQVICATNAAALVAMIELGARYQAARVTFKLAALGNGTEAVRITETQRQWLLTTGIPAATARAAELGVPHNLALFRAQVEVGGAATTPIAAVGCHQGGIYARVAVDGTAYYCCNTETAVGRLGAGVRFTDLWCGQPWEAMRARLATGRYFPGCHRCGKYEQNARLAARRDVARLPATSLGSRA